MVLEPCHWSGKIKDKIQIRKLRTNHQRHRCGTPIALTESCLGQQEARKTVGDVIHRCIPFLFHSSVRTGPLTSSLTVGEGLRYCAAFLAEYAGQLLNRRRLEQGGERQLVAEDTFNVGKQPDREQ